MMQTGTLLQQLTFLVELSNSGMLRAILPTQPIMASVRQRSEQASSVSKHIIMTITAGYQAMPSMAQRLRLLPTIHMVV